ncbi:hypothetical protein Q1695_000851 [Nippostrongylus brasiliensis]|nr:hypothetical protein Q1695_000851 [Nippostrongylus brasiliensis]
MPASYSNVPISGFTGHIPGAKWQVGSRYVPPTKSEHPEDSPATASFSEHSTHTTHVKESEQTAQKVAVENERRTGDEHQDLHEGVHRIVQFSPDEAGHGCPRRYQSGSDIHEGKREVSSYDIFT